MIKEEASGAPIYKPRLEFVLSLKFLTSPPESGVRCRDAQQGPGVFKWGVSAQTRNDSEHCPQERRETRATRPA